jgi:hypothetical protein
MDSPLSEQAAIAIATGEAARAGDWRRAQALLNDLLRSGPPRGSEALGEYLENLRQALVAAKASRSHLAATLHRVNAAAGFNGSATGMA